MIKYFILLIVFIILILPITYSIDLSLISKKNNIVKPKKMNIYVHRTNDIESVIEINRNFNNSILSDKNIMFGVEADLSYFNGNIVIAHDNFSDKSLDISSFLEATPKKVPVFFELKDTMNDSEAIKRLSTTKFNGRSIIFGSFNTQIIKKLNTYKFSNVCFLSWLLVPKASNYKWIVFEYYSRIFGLFGGRVNASIKVDYLAYNWKTMEIQNTVSKLFKAQRIAGSVDTKEAFVSVIRNRYSFFTDHPSEVFKWLKEIK